MKLEPWVLNSIDELQESIKCVQQGAITVRAASEGTSPYDGVDVYENDSLILLSGRLLNRILCDSFTLEDDLRRIRREQEEKECDEEV